MENKIMGLVHTRSANDPAPILPNVLVKPIVNTKNELILMETLEVSMEDL